MYKKKMNFKANTPIPGNQVYKPVNASPRGIKPTKNASFTAAKNIPRDPFVDMRPETKVPLNTGTDQRSFVTKSEFKGQIGPTAMKEGNVPPAGRDIASYRDSNTGDSAHKTVNMEWGRMQTHKRVKGQVLKPSNHPNPAINKTYG